MKLRCKNDQRCDILVEVNLSRKFKCSIKIIAMISTKCTCVSFRNQANVRSNSCREERKDQCHNSQLAKVTSTKAGGFVPVFHRDENLSHAGAFLRRATRK